MNVFINVSILSFTLLVKRCVCQCSVKNYCTVLLTVLRKRPQWNWWRCCFGFGCCSYCWCRWWVGLTVCWTTFHDQFFGLLFTDNNSCYLFDCVFVMPDVGGWPLSCKNNCSVRTDIRKWVEKIYSPSGKFAERAKLLRNIISWCRGNENLSRFVCLRLLVTKIRNLLHQFLEEVMQSLHVFLVTFVWTLVTHSITWKAAVSNVVGS